MLLMSKHNWCDYYYLEIISMLENVKIFFINPVNVNYHFYARILLTKIYN